MSKRDQFGFLEVDEGDFSLYVTDEYGDTVVIAEATGDDWSEVYSREIAKRFNACADLGDDPAAEITKLRAEVERLRTAARSAGNKAGNLALGLVGNPVQSHQAWEIQKILDIAMEGGE